MGHFPRAGYRHPPRASTALLGSGVWAGLRGLLKQKKITQLPSPYAPLLCLWRGSKLVQDLHGYRGAARPGHAHPAPPSHPVTPSHRVPPSHPKLCCSQGGHSSWLKNSQGCWGRKHSQGCCGRQVDPCTDKSHHLKTRGHFDIPKYICCWVLISGGPFKVSSGPFLGPFL